MQANRNTIGKPCDDADAHEQLVERYAVTGGIESGPIAEMFPPGTRPTLEVIRAAGARVLQRDEYTV